MKLFKKCWNGNEKRCRKYLVKLLWECPSNKNEFCSLVLNIKIQMGILKLYCPLHPIFRKQITKYMNN